MPGRFNPQIAHRDNETIRADVFTSLRVMRGRRGTESQVAQFQGRISNVSVAAVGRDHQGEIASTGSTTCVINAPPWLQLQRGDEVWAGNNQRYRVTAVDTYPGHLQVIVELLS